MKFGRIAVASGEGAILAHSVRGPGLAIKKGERISQAHVAALATAGIDAIIAATLEADDIEEDTAALRLAERIVGANVCLDRPFTGRCNLIAGAAGLIVVDTATVDAVNAMDEAITVATLEPFRPVVANEMIATVKIIPFAVPRDSLDRSLAAAPGPAVSVAPFLPMRVGVVSTLLPALKPVTVTKTLRVLAERLAPAGATIAREIRVPHEARALGERIAEMLDLDMVIIFGASAITDRRDVVPVGLERAGGVVEHLGMPVDPGNLLLLGHVDAGGRTIPVIGAPGCARSPKENGFDFVLRRLLAGLPVTGADLKRMGVGGLLSEIVSRPQLRQPPDD